MRTLRNILKTKEEESSSSASKAEHLLDRTQVEVDVILTDGHTPRLEHCISLMQLVYTHIDVAEAQERSDLVQRVAQTLERCYAVGENEPKAPMKSDKLSTVVCSYPRSGITVMVHSAATALQAQIFARMSGSLVPFSKRIYPKHYPFARLIKDHVARPDYERDRVSIIIRDGRDCMISLAYMTFKLKSHGFEKRGELADFIRWLDEKYAFGGWAKFMRDAQHLMSFGGKHLVRYEDFMAGPEPFLGLVRFFDPDHRFPDEDLVQAYEEHDRIFDDMKNNEAANRSWGIGATFERDSLFYEWSQNRQGSSWRESWDRKAKKAFHETGATDFLIEYGYETDPDWWKQ